MRKLRRLVAHKRMEKRGYRRVNKKHGNKSFFALRWREYIGKEG